MNKIMKVCFYILIFAIAMAWSNKDLQAQGNALKKKVRIVYPKQSKFQFQGLNIEGELKNPGEFYFQHRSQEKFDSLLDRRKDFHREMLRDVVISR